MTEKLAGSGKCATPQRRFALLWQGQTSLRYPPLGKDVVIKLGYHTCGGQAGDQRTPQCALPNPWTLLRGVEAGRSRAKRHIPDRHSGKEAAVTDFDLDRLSISELERLRDAINQRLLQLRYGTPRSLPELLRMLEEVKVVLSDQGKEWRSLERWQWMDGQIRFWLNPADQVHYRAGWYTIDELILWSQDRGPVLVPQEEEEEDLEGWTEINGVRIRWLPDGTMERL